MTVCATTEELFELVKSAYEAGMYGYSDLCEQVVESLVDDFVKDRIVEEEAKSSVLDQGFVSVGAGWSGSVSIQGTDITLPPQQQQPPPLYSGSSASSASGTPGPPAYLRQTVGGYFGSSDIPVPESEGTGRDNPHSDMPVGGDVQMTNNHMELVGGERWESPADNVMRPHEENVRRHRVEGLVNTGQTTWLGDSGAYSWHPYPSVGTYPTGMQANVITSSNTLTPEQISQLNANNLNVGDG